MLIEFEVKIHLNIPLEQFRSVGEDYGKAEEEICRWSMHESYNCEDYGYIPEDKIKELAKDLIAYQKRHPFNLKVSDIISTAKEGQKYRFARTGNTYTFKNSCLREDRYNKEATFTLNEIINARFRDVETEKEEEEWQPMRIK